MKVVNIEYLTLSELEKYVKKCEKELVKAYNISKKETKEFRHKEEIFLCSAWYLAGIKRGLSEAGRS